MRVLFISNFYPPSDVGGAEIAAHNSCLGLRQRGVQTSVLVITARGDRRGDSRYTQGGVPVHRVSFAASVVENRYLQAFDPRVYRQVLAELRRTRPHLVHIHNVAGASLAPFLACRRHNVPVVVTLHDYWLICPNGTLYRGGGNLCDPSDPSPPCRKCFRRYDFWGNIPRRRQLFARVVSQVSVFISPSHKLVDLHVAAGYDQARFRVVPNGIPPTPPKLPSDPWARRVVEECGLSPTLLFSGFVSETKGVQVLIEALPHVARSVRDLRLVVAGTGDARYLKALQEMEEPTSVVLGRLPSAEVRSLYATADLVVVPSIWNDNAPMVILESLLAGTPALGSSIGGIPELIRDGETGYLFPPGDAGALAGRVIQHFSQPAKDRRSMRRQCATYGKAHFTLEKHVERLLTVYQQVLEP